MLGGGAAAVVLGGTLPDAAGAPVAPVTGCVRWATAMPEGNWPLCDGSMAAENVQPLPWVLPVGSRSASSQTSCSPSKKTSAFWKLQVFSVPSKGTT